MFLSKYDIINSYASVAYLHVQRLGICKQSITLCPLNNIDFMALNLFIYEFSYSS